LPSALQRIVMFARGLMCAPRLLVLDQPGFGLNGEDIQRLFGVISQINHQNRTAVLIFEQNVFQALKLADTAWWMEKGRIAGERNGTELLADRALQATFPSHIWQAPGSGYHP
jgi:branched-chain amino acid transport system ATP-binding protein